MYSPAPDLSQRKQETPQDWRPTRHCARTPLHPPGMEILQSMYYSATSSGSVFGSEIWGCCDEISQSLLSDAAAPQSFSMSQHAPDAIFETVTLATTCTCQLHLLSRLTPRILRVCCMSLAEIPFNDTCLCLVSCHATFHLCLQKCTITFGTTSGLDERLRCAHTTQML